MKISLHLSCRRASGTNSDRRSVLKVEQEKRKQQAPQNDLSVSISIKTSQFNQNTVTGSLLNFKATFRAVNLHQCIKESKL